jgi:small-conductance mechanosensitive channel
MGVQMQTLPLDYLAEIARQIAFLSAFLGGFAATSLATLVVANCPKRVVGWTIGCVAFSASGFVIAVIASVMLAVVLHPNAPSNVAASSSVTHARVVSVLAFALGIYALLLSLGMSGWIHSRRTGIATSLAAILGGVVVTWAILGFG